MPAALSPSQFTPLKDTILFQPWKLGNLSLEHRLVQAPLTRMRSTKDADDINVPSELTVEYYRQRASKGGLLLTEATDISRWASGYPGVPGLFSQTQLEGWKRVTDAVHSKGGFIYSQIWHTGRASPKGLLGGKQPMSSSDIPISGKALDGTLYSDAPPRPMTVEEIQEVTNDFAKAAKNAIEAGFDGVEIHGMFSRLDQFLHDNVNKRNDQYGGSIEKRSRFPLEVIKATKDSDPNSHWAYICEQIAALPQAQRPSYVHSVEPRFDEQLDENAKLDALSSYKTGNGVEAEATRKVAASLVPFRQILQKGGVQFFSAGGFNRDNTVPKLDAGDADAIVMGRWFIANPDLPRRLAEGLPLNEYDRTTFYGASPPEKGYTDYPLFGGGAETTNGTV